MGRPRLKSRGENSRTPILDTEGSMIFFVLTKRATDILFFLLALVLGTLLVLSWLPVADRDAFFAAVHRGIDKIGAVRAYLDGTAETDRVLEYVNRCGRRGEDCPDEVVKR
jgi:hypothetical protein